MDNIDVEYAREKGLSVINTPAASSSSVAELVFAHLYGGVRFLYSSNRNMPLEGEANFKGLKKAYAKGMELRGKTLGIIGFGRIGQEVAKIALGVGMHVVVSDKFIESASVEVALATGDRIDVTLKTQGFDEVLASSDFITLHVPAQKEYVIDTAAFAKMKKGAGIINAARGGVIDEVALVEALDSGQLAFAALDTFENEPRPDNPTHRSRNDGGSGSNWRGTGRSNFKSFEINAKACTSNVLKKNGESRPTFSWS